MADQPIAVVVSEGSTFGDTYRVHTFSHITKAHTLRRATFDSLAYALQYANLLNEKERAT